ncbi:MAG: aminoglycoside phosphotransferase family protein [Actinobacteria bacterium]|nr:aminoglycoside phosphotransferase family protein [Actinomycetota bacterium]
MTLAHMVQDHIQSNAADWYPQLSARDITVDHLSGHRRQRSDLLRFRISAGAQEVFILCKVATPPEARHGQGPPSRPRLGDPDDASRKLTFEYEALRGMWARLADIDDRRLAAVRPLDLLEEHGALLIEEVASRSLRDLLVDASRPGGSALRDRLPDLFEAAGTWLGVFHSLELQLDGSRRCTPDDYRTALRSYSGWLIARGAPQGLLSQAVSVAAEERADADPAAGPGHGDCAPRNVLVRRDGRILMIDPLARWRVPVEDDLAYLVASLRVNRARVLTGGMLPPDSALGPLENALLRGHPGVSSGSLNASLVLILMDRWAASLARPFRSGPGRHVLDALERRRLAAELSGIVDDPRVQGRGG